MDYTSQQLKAAYALNLCTVSVSQIIDYADVNIMEQEYEAILNNLNLEQMPKDEALLKILKQIMDTITFFRMEEGDKKFIEKEYQQKMKNAIWSAVPNIGMLVAGGSAVTMAVSLASQVGIGYMNYRRAKAEGLLEKEKQKWQLERAAIEQFNGLRRELFDTAWRLSSEYEFPDELRLTERQIHQYNDILMDADLIRKYERLEAIRDSFVAYPPFWYQMGNTANSIARSEISLSEDTRTYYLTQAKEHFTQYRASNQQGLLREDPVSSACALELIDLLDINEDRPLISELLDEALRYSGRRTDILQLVAVGYLRLNEMDKAANILSQLVNEQSNTNLNAQLLSSIYVSDYLKNQSQIACTKYEILSNRVGSTLLYPMPTQVWENVGEIEGRFICQQREVLFQKYTLVLRKFAEQYVIKYGKLIPVPDPSRHYSDSYFLNTDHAIQTRKYEIAKIFANARKANEYRYRLQESEFSYQLLDLLNDMFDQVCQLDIMSEAVQDRLAENIENSVMANKDKLSMLQAKLTDNKFGLADMEQLLDISFGDFTKEFFQDLGKETGKYVTSRFEMLDFALAEQNLVDFCNGAGLPDPAELYEKAQQTDTSYSEDNGKRFDTRLLHGESSHRSRRNSNATEMISMIRMSAPSIVLDHHQVDFYTEENAKVERYFSHNSYLQRNGQIKSQVLAILDDKNHKGDYDLLFTVYGVIPVKNGIVKKTVPYQDIKWAHGKRNVLSIDGNFTNSALDMQKLSKLLEGLASYAKAMPEEDGGIIKIPEIKIPEIKMPFGKK